MELQPHVLFTDDGSDGGMGSGNLFLKNLGKVIGKNSNLFRPEDDWDPLAPLQKKTLENPIK